MTGLNWPPELASRMRQNRAAVREDIVRKGSIIVPLLLLLLAVLIFLSYFGPPPPVPAQGYRMLSSISTRKLSSQAARLSLPRKEVFVSG